jgi:hypothetical protein
MKPAKKPKKETEDELVFTAKIVSDDETNVDRTFVIRFALGDDEIKVWENQSSGFRGGFVYRSPSNRIPGKFDPKFVYIGGRPVINGVEYVLTDASDGALNIMESKPELFVYCDLAEIMSELRKEKTAEELLPKFLAFDKDRIGRVLIDEALKVLADPELKLNCQQIRTVVRRFKFYRTDRFEYEEFLKGF